MFDILHVLYCNEKKVLWPRVLLGNLRIISKRFMWFWKNIRARVSPSFEILLYCREALKFRGIFAIKFATESLFIIITKENMHTLIWKSLIYFTNGMVVHIDKSKNTFWKAEEILTDTVKLLNIFESNLKIFAVIIYQFSWSIYRITKKKINRTVKYF